LGTNLSIRESKLGFWGKNGVFLETRVADFCHNSPREPEASAACGNSPWRVELLAAASCTVTVPLVSRSCVVFARFCFELAFSVKMKVVDN